MKGKKKQIYKNNKKCKNTPTDKYTDIYTKRGAMYERVKSETIQSERNIVRKKVQKTIIKIGRKLNIV